MSIEQHIFQAFPRLKQDVGFKITSKPDYSYNCIAWAAIKDNVWMWPPTEIRLEGVTYWPDGIDKDDSLDSFIEAFKSEGYELCDDYNLEANYRKIALYTNPETKNCTHASRQLSTGFWTSKLGPQQDIQHSTPYEVEGQDYGKVAVFMRKYKL